MASGAPPKEPPESRYVLVRIKGVEHHFWLDEAKAAIRDLQEAVAKVERR